MHVGRSKYLAIATMALVATMILQSSYVEAEKPQAMLVKVTAINSDSVTVVKVENNKDNIYNIKLVWLTLQNGIIQSYKSADGWSAETASNQNTIQFRTDTNPVKPGGSVTFGIKTEQKSPIFKWIVLDEEGDQIGSGTLDVSKDAETQEKSGTSGSNNVSQKTNSTSQETAGKPKQNQDNNSAGTNEKRRNVPTVPPSIEIRPQVVKHGRLVKITGDGFTPDSILTVLFDGKQIKNLKIGTDGKVKGRLLLPKDVVNGAHQISISDTAGRAANIPITVKQETQIVELTVNAERRSYKQGDLAKLTGTGRPGTAVELTVNNPTGVTILSYAIPVDNDGKYSTFIPLSEDATPGHYEITVFQEAKTVKTSFDVLTITGSQLTLVTDKFEYKKGESVKVSGKAVPNKDVNVRLLAPDGSEVLKTVVKTDGNGTYTVSMPLPSTSVLGKYSVAVKVDTEEISISITIVQGSVTVTVQTEKDQYRVGELVRISGKGKANEKVSITIKPPKEEPIKMSANTDNYGSYSALWLVPAAAAGGIYKVSAEQGDTRAETAFLVST